MDKPVAEGIIKRKEGNHRPGVVNRGTDKECWKVQVKQVFGYQHHDGMCPGEWGKGDEDAYAK